MYALSRAAAISRTPERRRSPLPVLALAAASVLIHLPFLRLPFHWYELGQFVPAALDIFRCGEWIPNSTLPNVHPPFVMGMLAVVWKVFGYSIVASRLAML